MAQDPRKRTIAPKPKPNAVEKLIQDVTNRYRVTAREARDIVTAVGSAATATRKSVQKDMPVGKVIKNVAKQVKEVGTAAATGKKGTTSYKVKPNPESKARRNPRGDYEGAFVQYDVTKPKKR